MKYKTGAAYYSKKTGKEEQIIVNSKDYGGHKYNLAMGGIFAGAFGCMIYGLCKYFYGTGVADGFIKNFDVLKDVDVDAYPKKNTESNADKEKE